MSKDVVFFIHRIYPRRIRRRDDIDLGTFKRFLEILRFRYRVVPLESLFEEKSDVRRAALTFDDGYADNFVYAYPLIKSFGMNAHIFITSGRINTGIVRKTLFDYWDGRVSLKELFVPKTMHQSHAEYIKDGSSMQFLSWEEINAMKDTFTFGSHGMTHLAYPRDDEIVDFFDGSNFHWTMYTYSKTLFEGLPVFPTGSGLAFRRFYPSRDLINFCRDFGKDKRGWKRKVMEEIIVAFESRGHFESQPDFAERVNKELADSKRVIEQMTGFCINTFSWPFGQYCRESLNIASRYYRYIFTIKKGFIGPESDRLFLPRVSVGRDIFTAVGRIITFSTGVGFSLYRIFRRGKVV